MTIRSLPRKRLLTLFALALVLGASFSLARAAVTIQVTTTADTLSVDGACSLREAITAANTNTTSNECVHDGSSGLDTITFAIPSTDVGCAVPNVCTITLGSVLPTISDDVTINGSGQKITVSGNNATQVMEVGATLNLQNMTIANGRSVNGGGINNGGTLNVTNSAFTGNHATSTGSAISTGGGVANITNSTFTGNSSSSLGAVIINSSGLNITNSTFFGNTPTRYIIDNRRTGTANLTNSTFASASGNGVINEGTMTLRNTIFDIPFSTDCFNANPGTLTADSHNLDTDGSCDNATTKTSEEIALAAALADNGGFTQTLALGTNSAAIDAGDAAVCAAAVGSPTFGAGGLDQRGITRPQGTHCDVGAFERVIAYLTVIKHVDNSSGGSAVASNWTMNVSGVNPSQTSFPGAAAPGVKVILDPGAYSVTESGGPAGYQDTFSADCSGTLAAGASKTCTITNTQHTPTPTNTPTNTPTFTPTFTPTNTPTVTPTVCAGKPAKPTLLSPANNATVGAKKVALDWTDTACATKYKVKVKNMATGEVVFKKTVTVSNVKTTSLPNGTYSWSVKAQNDAGKTKSDKFKFTRQ